MQRVYSTGPLRTPALGATERPHPYVHRWTDRSHIYLCRSVIGGGRPAVFPGARGSAVQALTRHNLDRLKVLPAWFGPRTCAAAPRGRGLLARFTRSFGLSPRLPGRVGAIITDRRPIYCTPCMSSCFLRCRLKIPDVLTGDVTINVTIVPFRRQKLISSPVRPSVSRNSTDRCRHRLSSSPPSCLR